MPLDGIKFKTKLRRHKIELRAEQSDGAAGGCYDSGSSPAFANSGHSQAYYIAYCRDNLHRAT